MPYETCESEESLFANERKEGEKQPDYRGTVRIAGVLYRLSGWKRTAKSGTRWLALKIDKDRERQPATAKPAAAEPDGFDDDIPF